MKNETENITHSENDIDRTGQRRLTAEVVLEGIGVAPGIAIGPAYLYTRDVFTVIQRQLRDDEIEAEIERFERAVFKSEKELKKITSVAREKLGDESGEIFEAQALMLRDEALYNAVIDKIRQEACNADFAVQNVMTKHRQLMKASDSEYLRERANDLLDVQDRIIRHLRRGKILSAVGRDTIVVAENLTAADIILFSRRNILGCALDFGGATSHVSIMARALNVPAVVSLHRITEVVENGDLVVLDGLHGRVIVNPNPQTLAYCKEQQRRYSHFLQEQKFLTPLAPETLDKRRVSLRANLEFKEELTLLREFGAEGVGLFRTEILLLMQGRISFSEEEQFSIYKQIVEHVRPGVTTFRMFDLGGDKVLPLAHREQNPFLGWRGIRVLLDKPDLLIPQLRALLRASAYGPIRLLLPMVTQIDEVVRFRRIVAEVVRELDEEGVTFDHTVPIGIMVEVPSVALMADNFAEISDFFSIGSNDLTQYTLAVDRGNDLVSALFHELHPAILHLIKKATDAAHRKGISVSICGEIASNPYATPVFIGLGIDELSASPRYLPEVKRVIRSIKASEAEALARSALAANEAKDVMEMIEKWLDERGCNPARHMDTSSIRSVSHIKSEGFSFRKSRM